METAPGGGSTLPCRTLGLELRAAPGREMRFRDPVTGSDLHSYDEEAEGRRAAEARAAAAEARANAAEARAATAEALLRRRADR